MQIIISPWISTKSYQIKSNSEFVSFINDIQKRKCFVINGTASKLWQFLLNHSSFNEVLSFAEKLNFKNSLNQFIAEFQQNNIIQSDLTIAHVKTKFLKTSISFDSINFSYFEKLRSNFIGLYNLIDIIYLELNYNCNLKCKHCFNPKNMNNNYISFEQAKKIIDEAIALGISEVDLTGGECTINKDFVKIAEYIRKNFLELSVLTNGQEFYDDNNLFNQFINLYPSLVKISLYSMNAEVHDYITGVKGSHFKTLSVIKRLRENRINVKIACPQLSYNFNSYKEVFKFAKYIGAKFSSGVQFINNKNNNNIDSKLSKDLIEKFYFENFDTVPKRNSFCKKTGRLCRAGSDMLTIRPNLDITPCVGFNYVLGNYSTSTLKELQSTTLKNFLNIFESSNLSECFKYNYCKFCYYCSLYPTNDNDFLKKSPILCEDAKAYQKAYLRKNRV